jgi:hypothetical protein
VARKGDGWLRQMGGYWIRREMGGYWIRREMSG